MKSGLMMIFAAAGFILIPAGCSREMEDTGRNGMVGNAVNDSFTEFVMMPATDETGRNRVASTRTAGVYNGDKKQLDFFWTASDMMWLQDDEGNFAKSIGSDISDGIAKGGTDYVPYATFKFPGVYSASEYRVRYTGGEIIKMDSLDYDFDKQDTTVVATLLEHRARPDKVFIPWWQYQTEPGVQKELAKNGDCGVAAARRQADGTYRFMLEHKAAYLTFAPYSTQDVLKDSKILKIVVQTEKAIAGVFDFGDEGIDVTKVPEKGRNNITLYTNAKGDFVNFEGMSNFDELPALPVSKTLSSSFVMVVPPGAYETLTVTYYIVAANKSGDYTQGTISKSYRNLDFSAGANTLVASDLQIPVFDNTNVYKWDAVAGFFSDASTEDKAPNRTTFPRQASRSCKDCPNVNEIIWYIQKGNSTDARNLWVGNDGKVHANGIWLKKQTVIASENNTTPDAMKQEVFDGVDYRTNKQNKYLDVGISYAQNAIKFLPPLHLEQYFFLPSIYSNGDINSGLGMYWSSSVSSFSTNIYVMTFFPDSGGIKLQRRSRQNFELPIWKAQ